MARPGPAYSQEPRAGKRGILRKMSGYEFFDHVADVGMRVEGRSLEDLFITAALGLMAWIGPPPDGGTIEARVSLEAESREELLVRWLQEMLYRFHLQHAYLTGVKEIGMRGEGSGVEALLLSRTWDEAARDEYREVKAVTYHQLRIVRRGQTWLASVIFDI